MSDNKFLLLNNIKGPEDIKSFGQAELELLCEEIRNYLIETIIETGGHLASNLGIVEISTALLYTLDMSRDKIIYDVGHQCYAHKLLTGRFEVFPTLRSFGGISGFPSPEESEYDHFITGHASTSLSAAIGYARASRINNESNGMVSAAVIGDGALTGGMAYEALNDGGASNLPLIVILNDNGMSISSNVGVLANYLSKLRLKHNYIKAKLKYHRIIDAIPLGKAIDKVLAACKNFIKRVLIPDSLLEMLGFTFLGTVDGNNINALIHAIEYAKYLNKPVIIHALTKKGKGYDASEADPEYYHGIPRQSPNHSTNGSFSSHFGKAMLKLASENNKLCAISAAMPNGTGLNEFKNTYPDRFFDVGIAEEHAVTMAGGIAKGGAHPVVALYSTFLQRSFDQLLHDISLQSLNVTLAIDKTGLAYDDGITHHGIYDVGFLSLLPDFTLYAPSNYAEQFSMIKTCVLKKGFNGLRYSRGSEGCFTDDTFNPEEASEIIEIGNDYTVVSYGMMINRAIELSKELLKRGKKCCIIKINRILPYDYTKITESVKSTGKLIVLEDVIKKGSVGSSISAQLSDKKICPVKIWHFCLPDRIPHGNIEKTEKYCGIDLDTIIEKLSEDF